MRDAGCGPALPRPDRTRAPADHRGARLHGVSGALSGRGARAPIERAGVRRGVLRGEGKGRAVLLGAARDAAGGLRVRRRDGGEWTAALCWGDLSLRRGCRGESGATLPGGARDRLRPWWTL